MNQLLKMSRESRKIYESVCSLCHTKGIEATWTPYDVYLSDMLMIKYYSAPIINIIKSKSHTIKKWDTKHGTMEYWIPMIKNMIGKSTSMMKPDCARVDWFDKSWDKIEQSFSMIINYVITDYGYDDMVKIQKIVCTCELSDIKYSCSTAKSCNVYDVKYMNAILEKEVAKADIKQYRMDKINDKANDSNKLLHGEIHEHTVMDMAMVEYNWNTVSENTKLEKMMAEKLKELGL